MAGSSTPFGGGACKLYQSYLKRTNVSPSPSSPSSALPSTSSVSGSTPAPAPAAPPSCSPPSPAIAASPAPAPLRRRRWTSRRTTRRGGGGRLVEEGRGGRRGFPACDAKYAEYTPFEDRDRSLRFERERLSERSHGVVLNRKCFAVAEGISMDWSRWSGDRILPMSVDDFGEHSAVDFDNNFVIVHGAAVMQTDGFEYLKLSCPELPKKGVISQSVKDVVQSLVDDDLVLKDKIGTSVYFCWNLIFPAVGRDSRKQRDNLKKGREEFDEREAALEELKAVELQHKKLNEELAYYADNDPAALEALKNAIEIAHSAANRWTGNELLLLRRGCIVDQHCRFCVLLAETVDHLFHDCIVVRFLRFKAGVLVEEISEVGDVCHLWTLISDIPEAITRSKLLTKLAAIWWIVWTERNGICFRDVALMFQDSRMCRRFD
uniref:Mnd1 HTH domain-containing protein n=1 Tax=Ananas comosus var. bracteatus TaxID=296719 RepID=A0A6V7NFT1_ANACO|nr:unnamed protein product [Ananas comosus var. bracteatus]